MRLFASVPALAALLAQLAKPVGAASLPVTGAEDIQLTQARFGPGKMSGAYVVRFTSPACVECRPLESVWTEALQKTKDTTVHWATVDCSKNSALCDAEHALHLPRIEAYEDGVSEGRSFAFTPEVHAEDLLRFAEALSSRDPNGAPAPDAPAPAASAAVAPAKVAPALASGVAGPENNKAAAGAAAEEEEVPSLTVETFNPQYLKGVWLIKFFSPYCPHCVAFGPKYLEAYKTIGGAAGADQIGVHLAEVNCVERGDLCADQGISGVPVIWAYVDGVKTVVYEGAHESAPVVEFIHEQAAAALGASAGPAGPGGNEPAAFGEDKLAQAGAAAKHGDHGDHGDHDDEHGQHAQHAAADGVAAAGTAALADAYFNQKVSHSKGESIKLSKDNLYSTAYSSNEPWLIKFYSPNCPHCLAMADDWTELAKSAAGSLNVGEVNCLDDPKFCIAEGIKGYPTIRYVHGNVHTADYKGDSYKATELSKFAQVQSGSLIVKVDSSKDLQRAVADNSAKGVSTYVYFYDEAATAEDWSALIKLAEQFTAKKMALYRTDAAELRKSRGQFEARTGLAYVDWTWTGADAGPDGKPVWFPMPDGHLPEVFRNTDVAAAWAEPVRFASPQKITPDEISRMGPVAKLTAILVTERGDVKLEQQLRSYRDLALEFWAKATRQQTEDLETMRAEKQAQLTEAKGDAAAVRRIFYSELNVPVRPALTFGYISIDDLDLILGKFLGHSDYGERVPGDLVVYDFHDGRYVDSIGEAKLTNMNALQQAVDEFGEAGTGSIKKSAKMPGIESPKEFTRHFNAPQSDALFYIIVAVMVLLLIVTGHRGFRRFYGVQRGPIIGEKMD